jgi:hypothetical protein
MPLTPKELATVCMALKEYCIRENAFPYDRPGIIVSMIKKHTGKDIVYDNITLNDRSEVGVVLLGHVIFR